MKIKAPYFFHSRLLYAAGLILFIAMGLGAQPALTARELFTQGKTAEEEENYYLAVEKFKAALTQNPHYLDPIKGLAECFFFLDEYQESLRWVELGKKYNQNDFSLVTLEGRINIVLGRLDRARELFTLTLKQQPNNIEAMTGIALLDVAAGRIRFAAKQFEDALVYNPQARITLLSLALIYENLGELEKANRFIELALQHHPNYFLVHYIAGRTYYLQGDWSESESHLKTALGLRGTFEPARLLLGNLLVVRERPDQAVDVLRPLLSQNPSHVLARYLLGVAYWQRKDIPAAVTSFEGAIGLDPNDEFSRLALEQLAVTELAQVDPLRLKLGKFRFERGKLFEGKNLLEQALLEYRIAIKLDPASKDAHLAFAGIFRKRGFPMKYLNQLELMKKDLGITDRRIDDDIAYYRTKRIGRVSERWKLDQHDIDLRSLSVQVFTLAPRSSLLHPASSGIVARFFRDVLDGYGKLRVLESDGLVAGYEEAFRTARTGGADYFILLSFGETDRTFQARGRLYLAKTGALLSDLAAERTGNDRVRDSLLKTGSSVNALIPLRGALLKKEFNRGVVDLGTAHGLKEKDTLVIVKAGKVTLESGAFGFSYSESDVVGHLTLEAVDEAVAEGSLEKKSFYDFITAGDEVLFLPREGAKSATAPPEAASPAAGLLRQLVELK